MKNKINTFILLFGVLGLFFSCSQEEFKEPSTDMSKIENELTVEEAKAFFELQITRSVTQSSNNEPENLSPGDFSPCWNQSISSNCKDISSIDVPILPQYKYKVVRSIITNGMAQAYAVNITQKLVISKNTKSDKILQYHMALIPDNSYYKKNKGDIGTHFISHGDKNEYSGLVIYSLPRIKMPVKIERYVSGEKIFSMLIPSKTSEETRLKKRIFKNLVKDMKFAVSRTTQTRFGEYDDGDWEEGDDDNWWEEEGDNWTEEEEDNWWEIFDEEKNESWFDPHNWSPHKDWEEQDDSDYWGDSSMEPDLEFGPWLQVYHKACGQLLTVVNWNDWDGGALYCSKCRKSVTDFRCTYSFY